LSTEDHDFLRQAAEAAAGLDWAGNPWPQLAEALKAESGRKGRALFHPLRLALTGRESGPEMAPLLARIGRDRAIARLEAAA
jgi:glutamyl-tRNA synthetase